MRQAGVVHQDIKAVEALADELEEALDRVRIANVAVYGAGFRQSGGSRLQGAFIARGDDDGGSGLGEGLGDGKAYAAVSSGDEGDFAAQRAGGCGGLYGSLPGCVFGALARHGWEHTPKSLAWNDRSMFVVESCVVLTN